MRQVIRQYKLPNETEFQPVCLAFHPSEDVFVAGLADGKICFWGIDDPTPLWVTTISELTDEKVGGDKTLLPVFKISWTPSKGSSNLTILGGRAAGQSTLNTLQFANTPFNTIDQLVPSSGRSYDELSSLNIKDFVVITETNHILVLDSNGNLTCTRLINKTAASHKAQENRLPYLPFLSRPAVISAQAVSASIHSSKTLLASDRLLYGLAGGGISRPVIRPDGPDPRLSKVCF